MDIHRCRFVPYPPSTINALAFSHPSSASRKARVPATLRLAIGRANGDIEIWNPQHGAWAQETIFRGGKDRSIEGLVWTQEPDERDEHGHIVVPGRLRLFSIGYSSFVTEWDLELGRPARHSGDNFGEIWCLAAQPRSTTKPKTKSGAGQQDAIEPQDLVVGCADGAVVLLSTADGELRFKRSLSRASKKKARVLSVTFQSKCIALAGCADGTIRVMDTRNGNLIRTISLGVGASGGPRDILVWAIKSLPDGTLMSGDSTGEIRLWDGKTYTLVQRVKSHRADVLDVECSADGETLMSAGMDRRTVMYRKSSKSSGARWAATSHQRYHTHDVKVLAKYEAGDMSVLASGGPDTSLVVVPIQKHSTENVRKVSTLPQEPQVQSAPLRRLLMTWWDRDVWLWRVTASTSHDLATGPEKKSRTILARIVIKGEENIRSASISADGSLLAVSTASDIKLFSLKETTKNEKPIMRVNRLSNAPKWEGQGARLVSISPDSRWLCAVTPDSRVMLGRMVKADKSAGGVRMVPTIAHLKRRSRDSGQTMKGTGALGRYERSVHRAAFSADSRILVVGDLSGYLDSWVLEGYEDLAQEVAEDAHPKHHTASDTSSDGSGDEDDADSDDSDAFLKKGGKIIMGQQWVSNPSASLLPKLPSAPALMSFRPAPPSSTASQGAIALHPTRHDPHPHSHDLPVAEDRLFIVTTQHQLFEFAVLTGKLTPWSRRNPTATAPNEFRILRDRAMGCTWDLDDDPSPQHRERIWIYGNTWLCMFDLSQDFPRPAPPEHSGSDPEGSTAIEHQHGSRSRNRRKRKRTAADAEDILQEHTTGAGSQIPDSELVQGMGRKIRKIQPQNGTDGETLANEEEEEIIFAPMRGGIRGAHDQDAASDAEDDNEDEMSVDGDARLEDGGDSALTRVRRASNPSSQRNTALVNGSGLPDNDTSGDGDGDGDGDEEANDSPASSAFYLTHKYRPILGMVPLGPSPPAVSQSLALPNGADDGRVANSDGEGEGHTAGSGLEVALVERPMWDVDLPPRYFGDQDWAGT